MQTTVLNLIKVAETSKRGSKHCGKRRNCSLQAISPFSCSILKIFVLQTHKSMGLFGKGLSSKYPSFHIYTHLYEIFSSVKPRLSKFFSSLLESVGFEETKYTPLLDMSGCLFFCFLSLKWNLCRFRYRNGKEKIILSSNSTLSFTSRFSHLTGCSRSMFYFCIII